MFKRQFRLAIVGCIFPPPRAIGGDTFSELTAPHGISVVL
jgi:hypothetical protein